MLYKPNKIHSMWDSWLCYSGDTYYLYYLTMGLTKSQRWHGQGVAMATSKDGVHWVDMGVVLPKDEGAGGLGTGAVWPSIDFETSHTYIMNYSTWFDRFESQDIRFAQSSDLVHWQKLGPEYEFKADPRWYETYPQSQRARWDSIYAIDRCGGGMYGYWTALPKGRPGFGFGESIDGAHWTALEPPIVEHAPQGAVSAAEQIGGRFYVLYHDGELTLVADAPTGPFRPAYKNPELLNGNCHFARFFHSPDGLLVCHTAIPREGYSDPEKPGIPVKALGRWALGQGVVHFAPLKRALVDGEGTLRLGYWQGNESLKGRRVAVGLASGKASGPIRVLDVAFDPGKGLVLEGSLPLSPGSARSEAAGESGVDVPRRELAAYTWSGTRIRAHTSFSARTA